MKKILLIPTYYYLSNPIYIALKDLLTDFHLTYFFTKDMVGDDVNIGNISYEKIGKYFDDYKELAFDPSWFRMHTHNKVIYRMHRGKVKSKIYKQKSIIQKIIHVIKSLHSLKVFRRKLIEEICELKPDLVISTSDMILTMRIIGKYYPKLPVVIIQPAFLNISKNYKLSYSLAKHAVNRFINEPFYPNQSYFGLEYEHYNLLCWGEKAYEYYSKKRENVYKVVNPAHSFLREKINELRAKTCLSSIIRQFNLNPLKKTIIIFASDLNLLYGQELQHYLEDSYVKLINENKDKFNFIIKIHPMEDINYWKNIFREYLNDSSLAICKQVDTHELMALGCVSISTYSYASLEAAITGMVTINFTPGEAADNVNSQWLAELSPINVKSYDELNEAVKSLNDVSIFKQYEEKSFEAISDLIDEKKCTKEYWNDLMAFFINKPLTRDSCNKNRD